MKTLMTLTMLAAMAAAGLAQDPNRNRMNETYPKVAADEHAAPSVQGGQPAPWGNRLNVVYQAGAARELTGAPPPNRNRMNETWPKAAAPAPPKEAPQAPVDPTPSP